MDEKGTKPTELPRLEVQHVKHPRAVWTSFDRYSRYAALSGVVRESLGPGRHTVLDVGDASGYMQVFDDGFDITSVDVEIHGDPLPGVRRLLADGSNLPFPDRSFDAVISSDALEHVAPGRRDGFLAEMARVTRDLVAVAAPFDTPGVGGAEELVRRYALLATGRSQTQLEEHRDYGLPRLELVSQCLTGHGLQVEVRGDGNLHDWVSMMLLKHQLMPRAALAPLEGGYDIAYNFMFAQRAHVAPFYRHVVAGRRGSRPSWSPVEGSAPTETPILLSSFISANISEVVRQDVVPGLEALGQRLEAIQSQLSDRVNRGHEQVLARLDQLEAHMNEQLEAHMNEVAQVKAARERPGAGVLSRFVDTRDHVSRQIDYLSERMRSTFEILRRRQ